MKTIKEIRLNRLLVEICIDIERVTNKLETIKKDYLDENISYNKAINEATKISFYYSRYYNLGSSISKMIGETNTVKKFESSIHVLEHCVRFFNI